MFARGDGDERGGGESELVVVILRAVAGHGAAELELIVTGVENDQGVVAERVSGRGGGVFPIILGDSGVETHDRAGDRRATRRGEGAVDRGGAGELDDAEVGLAAKGNRDRRGGGPGVCVVIPLANGGRGRVNVKLDAQWGGGQAGEMKRAVGRGGGGGEGVPIVVVGVGVNRHPSDRIPVGVTDQAGNRAADAKLGVDFLGGGARHRNQTAGGERSLVVVIFSHVADGIVPVGLELHFEVSGNKPPNDVVALGVGFIHAGPHPLAGAVEHGDPGIDHRRANDLGGDATVDDRAAHQTGGETDEILTSGKGDHGGGGKISSAMPGPEVTVFPTIEAKLVITRGEAGRRVGAARISRQDGDAGALVIRRVEIDLLTGQADAVPRNE